MASNEQNVAGLVLTDAADPKLAKIYSKVRKASDPYTFPHFVASCSIKKIKHSPVNLHRMLGKTCL